jgi:NAD(P)-dependent dehydrogenase (short-subunit alcohol dehydrogenase family)
VRVGPAQVGAIAAAGVGVVRCARRPRALVVPTGTELRAPGEELGPGEIYESNGVLLEAQLREAGAEVELVARRPDSADDAEAMVDAAVRAHGRVDLLVTAAGVNKVAFIQEQDPDDWQAVMDANVRGTWLACRAAGRRMLEQGEGGKVVLVSSTRGKLGHPAGYSAYCASKAAIDGLTRTLACEWGKHGITVNAIGPTVFRSALTGWMFEDEGPGKAVREAMLARIPLGRLGEPEDLVGPLVFLLSDASKFVTGQVLYADGGYTAG